MIEKYVPVDPQMIDGVPLLDRMDEYKSWAWEIKNDRDLDLDSKHLDLDIDKDDLLDDLESVYMVDTRSYLHKE